MKVFFQLIMGKNNEWQQLFELETTEGIEKLEDDFAKRNLLTSGIAKRKISRYKIKRKAMLKEEGRRRLLEGLGVIPPWFSLTISIIALIISLIV